MSKRKNFTVAIFGSARIRKDSAIYREIRDLAAMISAAGMSIVTGGGPGLMSAATEGHYYGRRCKNAKSIGLRIRLPFEEKEAFHLDIKKEFKRFSNRLDAFMRHSNVVVVAPGGIGTLLEFTYTWQLLQVKHISNIPIILLGRMWFDFVKWVKKWPLKHKLIDPEDVELLFLAKDIHEAFSIIKKSYELYEKKREVRMSKLHEIRKNSPRKLV
ncbi:MAG: LOG family protein [Crenarchaeota archaeon]|nr:LOG family protein [Thermoproteota archaeon]MDW8033860.1 LOG family protein [Nitrososphaerota archaeon]